MSNKFNEEAFISISESGKKYYENHKKAIENPRQTQMDFLMELISNNKNTEYGKTNNFENIKSYEDFANSVPISEYDNYLPYITRMIEDKKTDLITKEQIVHYAASSGSTGVPKRIPVSLRSKKYLSAYAGEIVFYHLSEQIKKQGKKNGPICFLPDFYWDYIDEDTTIGSISAHIGYNFKDELLSVNTSPESLQYLKEHSSDSPYLKALFALQYEDLSCIYATFSSVVYEFLHTIETSWKSLCDDIRKGDINPSISISDSLREELLGYLKPNPVRADELEEEFNKGFDKPFVPRIWPNMAMYSCIGGSFFSEYTKKIRLCSDDIPMYMLSYTASESQFAIPLTVDDTMYSPNITGVFFEFRSLAEEDENRIYLIDELEVGKDYELIITNMSGFYRYRMFDVFHVDKLEGNSPLGHIAFRLNQMVNMVGEHVSTEDIEYVVKGISQHEKTAITEYALYTDYSTTPGRYIILIEPEVDMGKGEMKHLNGVADELFKKGNRSYKKYREQSTLGAPSIIYIDPGAFQLYKELQIASGISANQVKPVRLIDNKNKEQFFFGLSEGPYKAMQRALFDAERELMEMELLKIENKKLKKENDRLRKEINNLKER